MFAALKFIILSVFLLLGAFPLYGQYAVKGGNVTPLLAVDRRPLQVYLVSGIENVTLEFISKSEQKHQWYRYKQSYKDAIAIECQQSGNVSVVSNLQSDCGYFVEVENKMEQSYLWIADYNQYVFTLNHLDAIDGTSPCSTVRLKTDVLVPEIAYYKPDNGERIILPRIFTVSYNSLKWNDETKNFDDVKIEKQTVQNINEEFFEAPLCDTQFLLKGDRYAEYFGKSFNLLSDVYEAKRVEIHADTTHIVDDLSGQNFSSGFSAPATFLFSVITNEPVASLCVWKIYRVKEGENNPLVRFTGESLEYTFKESGKFKAQVEVSDRNGICFAMDEFEIQITESKLEVPNAFSPGITPGINDKFMVSYKSLVKYNIHIFNRWGNLMYRSTNPAEGWDGRKGGKYVAPGVYYYVIDAVGSDGIKYKKKGDINILRSKTIDDEI